MDGWLAPNALYPGVAEALGALLSAEAEGRRVGLDFRGLLAFFTALLALTPAFASPSAALHVVTTKDARFTDALLDRLAGVRLAPGRIHSQARARARAHSLPSLPLTRTRARAAAAPRPPAGAPRRRS